MAPITPMALTPGLAPKLPPGVTERRAFLLTGVGTVKAHRSRRLMSDPRGYVRVFAGIGHPLAWADGYAYEHRIIAAEAIGRPPLPSEIVHHRDGNPSNNDPSNLDVLSHWRHSSGHYRKTGSSRREPGEPNSLIRCSCGCRKLLTRYDSHGRPRNRKYGHPENTRQKSGEPNPFIACACGCGYLIRKYGLYGRHQRFVRGHQNMKWDPRVRRRSRHEKNDLIECACGCGGQRRRYDRNGMERRYIPSHNVQPKTPTGGAG